MAALGLLAVAGCSDDDPDTTPRDRPLVALLADGRLVGGTTARLRAGMSLTGGRPMPASGRLIAQTSDPELVAVLLAARREVVVATARELRIRARIGLPVGRRTRPRVIVAPAPDRLVVLGDRSSRAGGRVPVGWVIDIPSRAVVTSWQVPRAPDRNWTVLDAAAASDGRRLYLSYHGGCRAGSPRACTTGADVISWADGEPLCAARASAGCVAEIHGEVVPVDGGALATGGDHQTVLRVDTSAAVTERWRTRLDRNHLMRLAYDAAARRVFALGSCLYAGGLARIDLDGGWRWRRGLADGGRPGLCGERIAAGGGLVVFTSGPEGGGGESEITVVDGTTGAVRARLPTAAPAVDLALGE